MVQLWEASPTILNLCLNGPFGWSQVDEAQDTARGLALHVEWELPEKI